MTEHYNTEEPERGCAWFALGLALIAVGLVAIALIRTLQ